jgi:hypothetical protein
VCVVSLYVYCIVRVQSIGCRVYTYSWDDWANQCCTQRLLREADSATRASDNPDVIQKLHVLYTHNLYTCERI